MNRSLRLDWITLIIYLALVCFGITNIYSSTFDENQPELFNLSRSIGKQLMFFGVSIGVAIFILVAPSKVFERFSSIIYLATILLLIGLYPFGNTISGSRSWYVFGGVSLQPAEFAKVAVALAIAKLLSEIHIDLRKLNSLVQVAFVIVFPMGLIFLQPDAGSAIVFASFLFVLFREGLKPVYLLLIVAMLFLFLLTLVAPLPFVYVSIFTVVISLYFFSKKVNKKVVLFPYLIAIFLSSSYVYSVDYIFNDIFEQRHRDRINIVLGKEVDTQGIGYNLNQSKIAIGSGGWEGKGFLQGTQTKGGFVPEQHTDYIFSTIGEEWGFKGTALVVLLFTFLILRILSRAEVQKNNFSRVYAYSVASILFVHFFINIGMSIGLVPTIGIPLPFISYGGSSLLAFTILIAIYLNLDANRLNEASF
jgi:rod shape determining protein RodA